MRRILTIAWLLAAAAPAWSQEAPNKPTETLIEVKYVDANQLWGLLSIFGAQGRVEPAMHVIAVRGAPDVVAAVVAAAKKLDVPPAPAPNLELTVYLVSGSAQPQGNDDVPQDLASTVKQLHSLFPYKTYKLADSFVLRGRSSDRAFAQNDGILPGTNLRYHFAYRSATVSGEPPRGVRLDGVALEIRTPTIYEPDGKTSHYDTPARITTDLDIREGQKTVVGKSNVNSAGDALILVIVPKVTD
jgi:hypothetical protein